MHASYQLLEVGSGFEAMKIAHEALPVESSNEEWQLIVLREMLEMNTLKFKSCPHAKEALLESKVVIAEATSDKFWGSGLSPDFTKNYAI